MACMDAWEANRIVSLARDVEEANNEDGHGTSHRQGWNGETGGRRFYNTILDGNIRAAVRHITDREKGGIYGLRDTCTKTDRPVLEIMREKHPDPTTLVEVDFNAYANVSLPELLEPMPLFVF